MSYKAQAMARWSRVASRCVRQGATSGSGLGPEMLPGDAVLLVPDSRESCQELVSHPEMLRQVPRQEALRYLS